MCLVRLAVSLCVLACALVLVPGVASAQYGFERGSDHACPASARVPYTEAECVHVWWSEEFFHTSIGAERRCREYLDADVVVKFDVIDFPDATWSLSAHSGKRRGVVYNLLRDIWCCSDRGICNRSDFAVDWHSCQSQIERSPLSTVCTAEATHWFRKTCTFDVRCPGWSADRVWSASYLESAFARLCGDRIEKTRCTRGPVSPLNPTRR